MGGSMSQPRVTHVQRLGREELVSLVEGLWQCDGRGRKPHSWSLHAKCIEKPFTL